jgi:DNA-nicking Smr family endonuclease|tara:strand:- start:425 stop:847 length:423 start_codon:yes stop_codon:yes gene_type:complete
LNNKLSDKDKKDWQNFTSSEEKVHNKDLSLSQIKIDKDLVKTIDLHGFSLENANRTIDEFINRCFKTNVSKITVITGKGLRSNNINNPYVSKNLSILKNSVPEFIKSNTDLMKKIKNIQEAKAEDGGSGAFNILLKKSKE